MPPSGWRLDDRRRAHRPRRATPSRSSHLDGARLAVRAALSAALAIGAALTPALLPGPLAIGAGIFVAMGLTHLLRWPNAEKLAGYTCGTVLLDHRGEPWLYGIDRLVEPALGIGVAVLVSHVPTLIGAPRNTRPPGP